MRHQSLQRRVGLLVLALVLVAASCGSTGGEEASGDGESPLAEAMGWDTDFRSEGGQADFAEKQRRVNELTDACMAAEGFEWQPETDQMISFDGSTDADGLEWGSDEWTRKWGFGITTQAFPQEMVGPDLLGMDESQFGGGPDANDPNEKYLETLSETEREKFYATLYGDMEGPQFDESMSEEEQRAAEEEFFNNMEPTGCMMEAQAEVFGDIGFGGGNSDLDSAIEDLYERIQSDPRIVAMEAETSKCMADKGETYTNMEDVYQSLDGEMESLFENGFSGEDDLYANMTEEKYNALSDAEREALDNYQPKLSDEAKATLADLQEREIKMAVALLDCGGTQMWENDTFNEVRVELEQQFVEEHADEIKAAAGGN